jgi:hypothetical protein
MLQLYDLAAQTKLIAQMQETSLTREDIGLAADPLVASPEWWDAIERGALRRHDITGVITGEWWGSMADWPEFELRDGEGRLTTWTREGDARRFAPGLEARVVFVEHPWKNPTPSRQMSRVVLGMWIEDGPARVSAFAPGPGGAGYALSRQHGEAAHFLYISDRARADELFAALRAAGRTGRVWGGGTASLWIVQIWAHDVNTARAEAHEL